MKKQDKYQNERKMLVIKMEFLHEHNVRKVSVYDTFKILFKLTDEIEKMFHNERLEGATK